MQLRQMKENDFNKNLITTVVVVAMARTEKPLVMAMEAWASLVVAVEAWAPLVVEVEAWAR